MGARYHEGSCKRPPAEGPAGFRYVNSPPSGEEKLRRRNPESPQLPLARFYFWNMATTKPRRKIDPPPLSELRRLVHYDPETGVFTHRVTGKGRIAGRIAGNTRSDGYLQIRVANVCTYGHRLAWQYVTGCAPDFDIDHIDGDPANNRFSNLRRASNSENRMNSRTHSRNTSGVKGVTWSKLRGKWQAQIGVGGRNLYLGIFDSIEEAAEVVRSNRVKLHGRFANHGA